MNRIAISPAAAAVLRALIGRAGVPRDRILLTCVKSVDWRSLTLNGERHQLQLRVPAPEAAAIVERMCTGLDEAEFSIPGVIVADIALEGDPIRELDGSISLAIEALTVTEN